MNSIKGRKPELAVLCETLKPDIILASETKIDKTVKHSEFLPPNYTGHIRHDHTLHGGGVLIAHKKDLVIDEIELKVPAKPHHDHVCWARLTVKNKKPVYIGSYYRSNSSNTPDTLNGLAESVNQISELTKNNPMATIILGGDFNVGGIDWENGTVPADAPHAPLCREVLNVLDDSHLHQLQKSPTREDATLDLYCTNKPGLVKSITTIPGFSDHDFLIIDSAIQGETSKKPPRKLYRWNKANWDDMRTETNSFAGKYTAESTGRSVQQNYTAFRTHIQHIIEKFVPSGWSRSRSDVPWLTADLKRKCAKKRRLYNLARKTKNAAHWAKYRLLAKSTKKEIKQAHWDHINQILTSAEKEGNPKPFQIFQKSTHS
jgi:hypothetical protein